MTKYNPHFANHSIMILSNELKQYNNMSFAEASNLAMQNNQLDLSDLLQFTADLLNTLQDLKEEQDINYLKLHGHTFKPTIENTCLQTNQSIY